MMDTNLANDVPVSSVLPDGAAEEELTLTPE